LAEGALARISSRSNSGDSERSVTAPVVVTTDLMPGVISLPHGWGHDKAGAKLRVAAERPGVNLNDVLDENLRDPLSGNAVLSGVAVSVSPA
jgi:anaerobic selenocysteine-containing dehydrogenase